MNSQLKWLILSFFFSSTPAAFAGSVAKVKDKKVYLVFTEDDSFAEGDAFYITNAEGKKIGLVLLERVKGMKAIGALQKGKANVGNGTLFKGVGLAKKKLKPPPEESDESEEESSSSSSRKNRWGGLLGYGMAKQDVQQATSVSSQSGSSIAIKGAYDYFLTNSLALRMMAGFEIFSVSGTGREPGASSDSTVGTDVTYVTADPVFHWTFMEGDSMNFYLVGGMGLFYPMSSSSTTIDKDTITSFMIGEFGGGIEFKFDKITIPLEVSYYWFPTGEDVETNVISVKTGILF